MIPHRPSHGGACDVAGDDHVLEVFGRQVTSTTPRRRTRWIERALMYWRRRGFPYPVLNVDDTEREFKRLELVEDGNIIRGKWIHSSTLGLRLANAFHPQIWHVTAGRHTKSPVDHFLDDETLHKLLHRAARFWPDRRCWNAQCIRSVLRIYGGGRVSNFRPAAARALISRYSRSGEIVLDFSAGFGGRLLGCLTLNRRYIGIDPALHQINGLRSMLVALRPFTSANATIVHDRAEDVLPRLPSETIDLVFSSPPYFNVERYDSDDNQSCLRYPTYRSWKELFLSIVISSSHRILRRGGRLVINVANTPRHAIASDIKAMVGRLFGQPRVLRLLMHTRPFQRALGTKQYRWEPVLVFTKEA
jgi:hypothetical protein